MLPNAKVPAMSWVKAASKSEDDVFDETADDLHLLSKEWESSMKKRVRDGYVDGADAGEEAALSVGFREGFREGAARTMAVGRLRGIVSAIGSWYQIQHPDHTVPASITDLLQRVSQHERSIIAQVTKEMENPPPSVDDVSESMEDLEVARQAGSAEGCHKSDCCKSTAQMDTESHLKSQTLHSTCSASSSACRGGFSELLQQCEGLVLEMGLPLELMEHIGELKNL
ncbi:OTU deubiquitinase with linear linkage specificity a [Dunckerocampus dactyliophorus]|uniref:OTU deubiquitinase with linear linkage specificity a n=1 Tax=Dunckerocampus dactyliophorus TaxID=161453 RepID=UPI002405F3DB|nr:OTU deubiquitinase with linear linkage specificity a [Dunckerocampus dactyliophorus]